MLLLERPSAVRPSGPVGPSAIAQSLGFSDLWLPDVAGGYNAATFRRYLLQSASSVTESAGRNGRSVKIAAGAGTQSLTVTPAYARSVSYTVVITLNPATLTFTDFEALFAIRSGTSTVVAVQGDPATLTVFHDNGTAKAAIPGVTASDISGRACTLVLTYEDATDRLAAFLDGAFRGASTTLTSPPANLAVDGMRLSNARVDYKSPGVDAAFFGVGNRAAPDALARSLSENPWQLFAHRRIWVPVSGGSSPVTITTGIGAATAAGTTAVVNRAQTIATGTGAASAAGVQAIINRAQFIAATIGAATASGTTASVNLARFVATGIGAATAAGTQASIVADGAVVITTGIGAATAAGVQARIDLARFIATGIGAAAASGTQATITNAADVVVSTGVGAAVADGAAATFIRNVLVACGVGNATADGTQATVIGEGLEPAETRRRGGGNRFVLARKRLPSAYLIDWLTNEEPSEETKRVIREIKAGRPLPERLDPPKVEKQITPEQLAAKLIPRRLINLSEVLPVEQTQLIRKAVRIAQERDDEDILMLL